MVIERLFGWDAATCFGSPLSIQSKSSVADPDTSAGDSNDDEETGLAATDDEIAAMRGGDDDEDDDTRTDQEEAREDPDDSDTTAKRTHRFSSHDAAEEGFSELQRHTSRLEAENAQMRADRAERELIRTHEKAAAPESVLNEAEMTAIGSTVMKEYTKLPKDKQDMAAAVQLIAQHMAPRIVQAAQQAAVQHSTATISREKAVQMAETECRQVMVNEGLDPKLHWKILMDENRELHASNPGWTAGLTPQEQYLELTKATKRYLKSIGAPLKADVKKANAEHNKEAGATLTGGTRTTSARRERQDDDEDDQKHETMISDLNENRASLRARSRTQYGLLQGRPLIQQGSRVRR